MSLSKQGRWLVTCRVAAISFSRKLRSASKSLNVLGDKQMSTEKIIRAWKDESYRNSLSDVERSLLPDNPAGLIELTENDMMSVAGGGYSNGGSRFPQCRGSHRLTAYCR
jgi:mersacidin/lichenicidin family type 2 lantibiotic